MALLASSTPEESASWLASHLPDAYASSAAAAAREHNLDGAALLKLTEEELGSVLGIVKFGTKRKLALLLKETAIAIASSSKSAGSSSSSASKAGPSSDPQAEPEPMDADAGVLDKAACDAQLQDECYALGLVKWVGDQLDTMLTEPRNAAWASQAVRQARLQALQALRAECVLPGVSIVVVGNTGAGKSTLLNAVLDETRVLPTNGMRACTASLIEMRYEDTDPATEPLYRGEVEFLTKAEWDKELPNLLDDLTPNDGSNAGRVNIGEVQPDHPSYDSWCRVYAVYGGSFSCTRERTGEKGPDGRAIYRNPTLESLKAQLINTRNITHALSTVKTVTANDALSFRHQLEMFMDSKSELVTCKGGCPMGAFGRIDCKCGSYWPIVKQVRIYSRRWEALKTGAVLVDAPGVHDDNSARDGVVKKKLKDADAVWIVSNIVRAVNDKTAKDLLGEQFRRQMLMDGQYGQLAFVATQSDVLERSEAVRSLKLPPDTTLRECAEARNAYTRRRLRQDFHAGLAEMAEESGDASFDAASFELPVFCVSSLEYQKLAGLRPHDGAPKVWSDMEQTMVPALVRHVQRMALARRKVITKRRCEAMHAFALGALRLLEQERQLPQATRDAAKSAYEAQAATLSKALRAATVAAGKKVQKAFDEQVAPQLKAGAEAARADAVATTESWGIPVTQGGMHWATYKATCRRHGVWRINMNEALVEPIFKAVSTHWEKAFISGLSTTLGGLEKEVQQHLGGFHAKLLATLAEANVPSAVTSGVDARQCDGLLNTLQAAVSELKDEANKQQRELSRSMEPLVQTHMVSGYDAANAEAGTGSHRRRVDVLERHVRKEAPKMFDAAAKSIVEKMSAMRKDIGAQLEKDVVLGSLSSLLTAYTPLWDEMGEDCLATRKRMQPKCAELLLEANNAVRRMKAATSSGSGGGGAASSSAAGGGGGASSGGGGGDDDDDELVETTDIHQKAKRQKQLEETIDLSADSDQVLLPTKLDENTGPQGPVKVKAEGVKPEKL